MFEGQPLKEGVVGREIVAYFEARGQVAVWAESKGTPGEGLHDYLITFDSGIKQVYRVTWADNVSAKILDMTPLN